jgi:DNA repair exonuclease SbcCD ATPase subunit
MDTNTVVIVFSVVIAGLTFIIIKIVDRIRCKPYVNRKAALIAEIQDIETRHKELQTTYDELDEETKALQDLRERENALTLSLQEKTQTLKNMEEKIASVRGREAEADKRIHAFQSKIDLYSRLDEFVEYGMYEMPEYLYETSERFAIEIKRIRDKQKEMIQQRDVIIATEDHIVINIDEQLLKRILAEQAKLMIRSFNIECDLLIEKVNPANLQRTLERIDAVATALEKSAADLQFGFNSEYIKLKYEECKLEYQFKVKKKEEQDEQRMLNEQMREEERARREYEKARLEAEKEEETFQRMLDRARQELESAGAEERQAAEFRIKQLEAELAEAKARAERAMSMAQQTKKGHVYIISNIGSFGENVYKIGLTRRLDPEERVKELGDASVPFSFDIHAMISSDDAPALEGRLHKAFNAHRVNAVNMRKEFFKVSLEDIKNKTEEFTGNESNFIMTVLADEYFQTKRIHGTA